MYDSIFPIDGTGKAACPRFQRWGGVDGVYLITMSFSELWLEVKGQ